MVLEKEEKISWADSVRNSVSIIKEETITLHAVKRRKANWIGYILYRNCLLKHVIEGKTKGRIEITGRGGRRRKQLLNELRKREDTES